MTKKEQRERKQFDEKKIKHLPTEYVNFDIKKIKERKTLVEENRKHNKLEVGKEEKDG